jgi:hypothetical protein
MGTLRRLLQFALFGLFFVPVLQAETLAELTRKYVRDYSAAKAHARLPSFSRQTGLACNVCHTTFPQLTPFGRTFKLNGYTLTGLQVVTSGDSGKRQTLQLDLIPPVSAMFQTSLTQTRKAQPGTQNGNVEFPQEFSIFFGEAITPRLGTFLQVTYDPRSGGIGIDNVDIRYANRANLGKKVLGYGFTMNNNPTVQDVWNTVPAWGFPFGSSEVAPTPAASVLLDGAFGQQVAGLGAYALFDNHLYGEFSVYRTAAQGGPSPPDATSTSTIHGVAPYWRAFYQRQWSGQSLMVGTIGMSSSLYPEGVTGLRNRFTDIAFDTQYERRIGMGNLTAHAIWLHERQKLDADFDSGAAENPTNTLKTLRIDASAFTASRIGVTLGYFSTSGSADATRFPAEAVTGSANGSPKSSGVIGELSAYPWLNTRFSLEYVAYNKFNGAKTNYDGLGRNAGDNNTLFLLAWLAF